MKMNEQLMLIHPLVWSREEERDVRALFLRDLRVPAHIGVNHQEQGRTQQLWQVDVKDSAGKLLAHGELRLQNLPASQG